jgi:hypothetical protein
VLFAHPDYPGRHVRLGYCLNLHAAESLEELLESLRTVTLPLRDRLAPTGLFGVGMYLPAKLARHLLSEVGEGELLSLREFLAAERLDPFTYNAFPFGDFQTDGLKESVYEPLWTDAARARYTLDVARLAQLLAGEDEARSHLSISTHGGRYGEWEDGERRQALAQFAEVLEVLEASDGTPVALSIEAEPCSSTTDTLAAAAWVQEIGSERLGLCLDCCHSAVEFEDVEETLAACLSAGLGKVQFSSALRLESPSANPEGVAALLALDEPRFLHQVISEDSELRASDLPELREGLSKEDWMGKEEWRCHFHVPVDLDRFDGLGTTSFHADSLVTGLLESPGRWSRHELHLEIETYTWSVLPGGPAAAAELVDALEREYRHVLAILSDAGWVWG